MKKTLVVILILLSFIISSCKETNKEEYKVSFETNGGSIISDVIIKDGVVFQEPTIPTKDGYEFDGWYIDEELKVEYSFETKLTSDLILYAKWIPLKVKFIIHFVSNGGNYIQPIEVLSGEKIEASYIPKKDGYIFKGWYIDEKLNIKYDFDSKVESDFILYAKWEENIVKKITINFITNCDKEIPSFTMISGSKLNKVESITKENYEFKGWYTNEELTNEFMFDEAVYDDITLYAKWELIKYTITFDSNGGNEIETITISCLETPISLETPVKTGYEFKGWYIDEDLYELFDNTKCLKDDITLYAKWEKEVVLSSDATLKNIYINGILVNNFSKDKYEYIETINSSKFVVSATTNDVNANIKGIGEYEITSGDSIVVKLEVIAQDNTKLIYSITVKCQMKTDVEFLYCAGLSESIAATFIDSNYKEAKVYYRKTNTTIYTLVDSRLITLENGVARVDILGLTSGSYDIKVITSLNETITKNEVIVSAFDRSGYAFFDTDTNKIGAYNEDGSLKSNADVIYVTNETKNTVKYNGKTGLVNILKSLSNVSNPVCIRIIGSITTNQFEAKSDAPRLADGSNYDEQGLIDFYTNSYSTEYGENLVGLTSKIVLQGYKEITHTTTKDGSTYTIKNRTSSSTAYYNRTNYSNITGKKVYDDDSSYNMVNVTTSSGLTIEGIGTQAEIFQWGINFSKSSNVEVRNLTFTSAPEDACSFSGGNNDDNDYYGIWVHNNTFNKGYNSWDITGERDKYNGDGAIDLRFVHGVTVSYNKFNNTHKTGLVGGSNSNMQYNITFHHNYYNNVGSRLPLGRQANMHIYNNYYYNCSSTLDIRANAYVLSEGNYFENSRVPKVEVYEDQSSVSAVKSFNDVFVNCSGTQVITIVNSRNDIVYNTNTYGNKFDTSSNLFYYDSVNNKSDVMVLTSAIKAKEDCINYAGVYKTNQTSGLILE